MRHKRGLLMIGGTVAIIVVGGAAFLYFSVFSTSAPAPVSLSSPSSPVTSPTATFDGSFDGTWTVDNQSGSFSAFTDSWAGYRIQEQLGGVGAHTAVGRTSSVTGSLVIQGSTISDVSVSVDMTMLQSDDMRRDNSIRMRGLETAAFPTATFKLTKPIEVGGSPQSGNTFMADAVGELTLHGVTRAVTVPMQGRWTGSRIEVVASFDVALADYSIQPPTGFLVLSIADQGKVELHLLFQEG
jgi:polyisoprenoid-binding protein YceI